MSLKASVMFFEGDWCLAFEFLELQVPWYTII